MDEFEAANLGAEEVRRRFPSETDPRPCKGTNANICVAEGCYGEACRTVSTSKKAADVMYEFANGGLYDPTGLAGALDSAGLLAGTANTAMSGHGYKGTDADGSLISRMLADHEDEVAKLRARIGRLVKQKNDYRDENVKQRAELADANLDREHAQEVSKKANERADDYNEAHRKTLDRTRRVVKERDQTRADLAELRNKVWALADEWEARNPDRWHKWGAKSGIEASRECHADELRALLADGK